MKRNGFFFFVVFFFIFFTSKGLAQYQKKIDSLLIVLQTAQEDTSKVHIYKQLCWNYGGLRTEIQKTRAYADSVLWLSEKLGYEEGTIDAHLAYGMVNRYEDNYAKALEHLKTYVEYHKKNKNLSKEVSGWFQMGNVYQLMGNYDESLAAHEYSLKIHEKNEHWDGYVANMNSIGIIYNRIGKYEKAIKSYTKAIQVNDNYGLNRDLTYISLNMGYSYTKLEQYDHALTWHQKSLKLATGVNNDFAIAQNLTAIGRIYNLTQHYEEALSFQLKGLEYREKSSGKGAFSYSLIELGNTYFKLKKFGLAEQHLVKGLNMAQEVEAKQFINDAYGYLTELYAETGSYRKAYEYGRLYHEVKDSIFSEKRMEQIEELQTKYETAQKDQEITLLTKESEVQQAMAAKESTLRNALIGGLLLLAIIAGLIFYSMRARLKNQKMLAIKNEEIKMANLKERLGTLEMKALRAQMNPHFLFNCMNSINRMIMEQANDKASKYLSKFSKLVRLLLENSENPKVNLKDELEMLKSYIELESIRFKNKMEYQIKVDKSIDQESTFIPSMVLQPFVENAIWHGLLHKGGKGSLSVIIKEEGDNLHCIITDNGVGRDKSLKLQKQSGHKKISMGIKITTDRLKLLTKQKIGEAIKILDLKDEQNNATGTQVDILIPVS